MNRSELIMSPGIGLMKRRLEKEKDAIALAISGIAKQYDKKPEELKTLETKYHSCLLYTSPSPRDQRGSRMPSSA